MIISDSYRLNRPIALCILSFAVALVSGLKPTAFDFRPKNIDVNQVNVTLIGSVISFDEVTEVFVPDFLFQMINQKQSQQPSSGSERYSDVVMSQFAFEQLFNETIGNTTTTGTATATGTSPTQTYTGTNSQPTSTSTPDYASLLKTGRWMQVNEVPFGIWEYIPVVESLLNQRVPFNLKCGQEYYSTEQIVPGSGKEGPPASGLMLFPSSPDFVGDFLSKMFNVTDPTQQISYDTKKIAALFLIKVGDPFHGVEIPYTKIIDLEGKMATGKCALEYNSTLFRGKVSGTLLNPGSLSSLQLLPPPPCDYKELTGLISSFEDFISKMSSVTVFWELSKLESAVSVLKARNVYESCTKLLDQALIKGNVQMTETSTRCQYGYGTLQYATEVCCNKTLAHTKCCAPRALTYNVNALIGVQDSFIATECNVNEENIVDLLATLNGYIDTVTQINNPDTGCAAETYREFGSTDRDYNKIWQKYSEFFDECRNEIFGSSYQGKTCTRDSDCYTSCGGEGSTKHCVIPYYNSGPYILKCYIDKMDAKLKLSLMQIWGVNNVSNLTAFENQFRDRASTHECTGPNAWRYNGGWYQKGGYYDQKLGQYVQYTGPLPTPIGIDSLGVKIYNESVYEDVGNNKFQNCYSYGSAADREAAGCFYLPPNRDACERESRCNWYRWDYNMFDGNSNIPCDLDVMGNDKYMCADCYGGNYCLDRSQKGGCSIPLRNHYLYNIQPGTSEWNSANETCASLGGQLWKKPQSQYSAAYCFTNPAKTYDQCVGGCNAVDGPKPGLNKVCVSQTLTQDACNNYWQNHNMYAYFGWFNGNNACLMWTDAQTCSTQGNGFAYLAYAQTPEQIKWELASQCSQSYCYNPTLTKENCYHAYSPEISLYPYWENRLNDSNGYCAAGVQHYSVNPEADCKGLGSSWKYYGGMEWVQPFFDNEKTCTDGICTVPMKDFLPPAECTKIEYCDKWCTSCSSSMSGTPTSNAVDSVCWHHNQTRCGEDSGAAQWTYVNTLAGVVDQNYACVYSNDNLKTCQAISGSKTLRCEELGGNDWNKCTYHPFSQFLSCNLRSEPCQTVDECRAKGECNDWDIPEGYYDQAQMQYVSTGGSCMLSGSYEYGYRNCHMYPSSYGMPHWSAMGCFFPSVDKATCDTINGTYMKRATKESECGRYSACCEKTNCYNPYDLTPKNAEECTKCKGKIQPYHTWQGGNWVRGSMRALQWKKRAMEKTNVWAQVVDYNKMFNYISQAIGGIVSDVIKTEQQCKIAPLLTYMKSFACACGTNVDDTCGFASKKGKPVASGKLQCGAAVNRQGQGASWNIPADGVLKCDSSATYNVEKYEPRPNKGNTTTDTSTTKRSRVYLTTRNTIDATCYTVVQNSHAAFIGQALGDCITFSTNVAVKNVELCASLKTTIPRSTSFPTDGIALKTINSANEDVYTASSTIIPFKSGTQFCFTVNSGGTYCPVGLSSGWEAITSMAKPTCQAAANTLEAISTAATALAAGATKLALTVQPGTTVVAGTYFNPAITVEFRDANNVKVPGARGSVTFSILSGSGSVGATVIGTVRVAAVDGIATFDKLSVDMVGTAYKIVATSGTLEFATSNEFSVTAGAAAGLAFAQQPGGCVETKEWIQNPIVHVVDTYGNLVSSSTASITLALTKSTGESVAVTGTVLKAAVNGKAEFTGLIVATSVNSVKLTATAAGLSSATGVTFNVVPMVGYPVRLRFIIQPGGAVISTSFLVQPIIQVMDFNNNAATLFDSNPVITIAIKADSGTSGASLAGVKSLTATGGLVQFDDLTVNKAGLKYKLTASAPGLVAVDSNEFTVNGPFAIAWSQQPPAEVKTSETFTAEVKILDVTNQIMLASSDSVVLNIKKLTGSVGATLQGIKNVAASSGTAKFTGLAILKPGAAFQLTASLSGGSVSSNSEPFSVSEPPANLNDDDTDKEDDVIDRISNATGLDPMIIVGICAACVITLSVGAFAFLRNQAKKEKASKKASATN